MTQTRVADLKPGDIIISPFDREPRHTVISTRQGMYGLIEVVTDVDGDRHLLSLDANETVERG